MLPFVWDKYITMQGMDRTQFDKTMMQSGKNGIFRLWRSSGRCKKTEFSVFGGQSVNMQSCKTCSNFLRVKFKVFSASQNVAFSNNYIYINSKSLKILNRPLIDLFLFPTDQYLALISWLIALYMFNICGHRVFDH